MIDPFGKSEDRNHFDIDFSIPMVHRLRFTKDCLGADFGVLRELMEPGSTEPSRVQVWVDDGLTHWDATLLERTASQINAAAELNLVSAPQTLPGGEAVKNDPGLIDRILTEINHHHLDRRSYILVVGGGAVLDAVGYAAAVAHRGIRLIRIPTTTLAQADSGVGVKNAVNWFNKKNWKGTFATPWAVVNDEKLLEGLSDRDFCCGFSEAVKVALLKDPTFFTFLCEQSGAIALRSPEESSAALRQSVLLHLWHITRGGDPFELQQARPLDFGHWSAHKLEAITDYRLRHGEAVSIGVAVDVAYSHLQLGLPREVVNQTLDTLLGLGLPISHACLQGDVIFDGLEEFRQHLGGDLTITLLKDVGRPIDVHSIDRTTMQKAIAMVAEHAMPDATVADDLNGKLSSR